MSWALSDADQWPAVIGLGMAESGELAWGDVVTVHRPQGKWAKNMSMMEINVTRMERVKFSLLHHLDTPHWAKRGQRDFTVSLGQQEERITALWDTSRLKTANHYAFAKDYKEGSRKKPKYTP